jgi:nitrogen fixation NifU-like protein
MTDPLHELYQEMILDHGKRPRNFHHMENPSNTQEAYNPVCGDKLTLFMMIEEDKIIDISFEGEGCAISMASASLMTEAVKGINLKQAEEYFQNFHALLLKNDEAAKKTLGKVAILSGVSKYPGRIKCATLAWHSMHAIINHEHGATTTE